MMQFMYAGREREREVILLYECTSPSSNIKRFEVVCSAEVTDVLKYNTKLTLELVLKAPFSLP